MDATEAQATADAGVPPGTYARLIANDEIWKEVPTTGGGGPVLHEARVSPVPFPRREWGPCGVGCRRSPSSLAFDIAMYLGTPTQAGAFVDGEGYLLLHSSTKEVKTRLTRLERLSDGATIGAVVARGQASAGYLAYGGGSAAFSVALGDGDFVRLARIKPDGSFVWQPGWRRDLPVIATQRFGIGEAVGVATYGGSVLFATPLSENPIELAPGTVFAHGQNGRLLFGYSVGTISSFTVAGGVSPLVTLPAGRLVIAVQTSPTRIVWLDGVRSGEGWGDMRWHWSPLATTPAEVVIHDGPSFPAGARAAPYDLHTTGDWAVTEVGIGPENVPLPRTVVAWNIASGATYVLPERPGKLLRRAFILTNTEMVLGYQGIASIQGTLDELVRLELATLPDVISRWSAGKE